MVERRQFLRLLGGGGLTAYLGSGLGGLGERVDGLGQGVRGPGARPHAQVGPDRQGWSDGRHGHDELDGYDSLDGPAAASTARVLVPMVFPVLGGATYTDTYLACRDGCRRRHLGQDLFAPKLQPVVATFDAVVTYARTNRSTAGNLLSIRSPEGWTTNYLHLNNDRPGTDDGRGTPRHTFAPGIRAGAAVRAGQLLGWLGDSGNAERVSPHLHFELRNGDAWAGTVHNPMASLDVAERVWVAAAGGPLPEGAVVEAEGVEGLWLIEWGRRRPLLRGVRSANGHAVQPIVRVSAAQLLAHPAGAQVPLRDGLIARDPDGLLWAVAGGYRHPLERADLDALGLDHRAVRRVEAEALATTPAEGGEEIGQVRTGALLRAQGTPQVWLLAADGTRRYVPDQSTFSSWGWWPAEVAEVPAGLLDELPAMAPLPLRDGTFAATPDGALYLVSGCRARRFRSEAAAVAAGWPRGTARTVTAEALARLPAGFPMP